MSAPPPLLRPPTASKKSRSPRLKIATLPGGQQAPLRPPKLSIDTHSVVHSLESLSLRADPSEPQQPQQAPQLFSAEIIAEMEQQRDGRDSKEDPSSSAVPTSQQQDVEELDEEGWKRVSKNGEIVTLSLLGEGAGGSVSKCRLKHGTKIFALKEIILTDSHPDTQKQILRELQFNKSCISPYIVKYYGMFLQGSTICISMEYMGGRSLDAIYKQVKLRGGRIGEKVLGKIAESMLKGLSYLHENRIIHRDIKPQNILLDSKGNIKLCDFGVSGVVVNSLATTFTGTSYYMAPERIQGQPYSVTSDIWSLGLTLLEVAMGEFPYPIDKDNGIAPIEVLTMIMTFQPTFKNEDDIQWTKSFQSFITYCLEKNPKLRASPRQMLQHPWILGQSKKSVNMEKFIKQCWDDNI